MNNKEFNNYYFKITAFVCLIFLLFTIVNYGIYSNKAAAVALSLDDQSATIMSIKKIMPAVVSIIIYDQSDATAINLFTGEVLKSTAKVQKGQGTGFLISADGLILTNKHVVSVANESTGEYRIILNSGKQYYAQLIGKDPINDLAVLKIFDKNLPFVDIGDSDSLQIGTTVIAIGNTLGRYQNSATKGIVSGLGRSLVASDFAGNAESLDNVVQTDASINPGNSGGPLIDLTGKVVGVNVAMDQSGVSVGFAIPINDARQVVRSVKQSGRIIRPRLGIRYIMLTPEVAQDNNLKINYGAWISQDETGNPAILPDSPAAKAGLKSGDIVLEINGIKVEGKNTLLSIVQRYKPGDKIGMKIQRGDKIILKTILLDEFK